MNTYWNFRLFESTISTTVRGRLAVLLVCVALPRFEPFWHDIVHSTFLCWPCLFLDPVSTEYVIFVVISPFRPLGFLYVLVVTPIILTNWQVNHQQINNSIIPCAKASDMRTTPMDGSHPILVAPNGRPSQPPAEQHSRCLADAGGPLPRPQTQINGPDHAKEASRKHSLICGHYGEIQD